jgi:putative phosphoribosyl transferase
MDMRYFDRRDAGRKLAELLRPYAGEQTVVLALPRGGVPVGFEVALALNVPLDIFVVRKLGAPGQPELAIGAVASGGVYVLNHRIVKALGVTEAEIAPLLERESQEIIRREKLYRGDRPPIDIAGKTVIVTDDGLATGASMLVSVDAIRALRPQRIVVAVPVAPPETITRLRHVADDVVCPLVPPQFNAVGEWYENFAQTTDDEVKQLLSLAQR